MKLIACIVFVLSCAYGAFACTVTISNIKTNSIYGKVISETKEFIPKATIQIYKNTDDGEKVLAEIRTDENGRFELKNFPAGNYMIKANAEGFAYSYASMKLKKSLEQVKKREIVFTLVLYGDCSGWAEMQKIQNTK